MDGLITGTIFYTVTLLFIKIGERIDDWFTRRHQKWLEPKAPTLNPGTGVPRYGPSYREMRATVRGQHVTMQPLPLWETEGFRQTLIAMGRAWRSIPIDTTLKGDSKPSFLTDQEWMDQTIERSLSNLESETHVDEDWYIKTEEEFEASSKKVQEETINSPIIL